MSFQKIESISHRSPSSIEDQVFHKTRVIRFNINGGKHFTEWKPNHDALDTIAPFDTLSHHWQTINPISLDNTSHQGTLQRIIKLFQQRPRVSPFAEFTFETASIHPTIRNCESSNVPAKCLSFPTLHTAVKFARVYLFDPFTAAPIQFARYQGHLSVSYDLFGQVSRATYATLRFQMKHCDVLTREARIGD